MEDTSVLLVRENTLEGGTRMLPNQKIPYPDYRKDVERRSDYECDSDYGWVPCGSVIFWIIFIVVIEALLY